jgi:hypothetical protein
MAFQPTPNRSTASRLSDGWLPGPVWQVQPPASCQAEFAISVNYGAEHRLGEYLDRGIGPYGGRPPSAR